MVRIADARIFADHGACANRDRGHRNQVYSRRDDDAAPNLDRPFIECLQIEVWIEQKIFTQFNAACAIDLRASQDHDGSRNVSLQHGDQVGVRHDPATIAAQARGRPQNRRHTARGNLLHICQTAPPSASKRVSMPVFNEKALKQATMAAAERLSRLWFQPMPAASDVHAHDPRRLSFFARHRC